MVVCGSCGNSVLPVRSNFNWVLFIILLLFTFLGAFIYLIIHASKSPTKCPICGNDVSQSAMVVNVRNANVQQGGRMVMPQSAWTPAITGQNPYSQQAPTTGTRCHTCGGINAIGSITCQYCGSNISPANIQGSAQPLIIACPSCNSAISYGTNPCPQCRNLISY
jgi:hypothetical protein